MTLTNHPLVAEDEMTCGACPVQIEGTLTDGRTFYFRYRYGYASLGVGDDLESAVLDSDSTGIGHGDNMQGVFDSDDEMRRVFSVLALERLGELLERGKR